MSKIKWDQVGDRLYETGVDHVVLYPIVNGEYPEGVAWSGVTAVNEKPSGAEPTELWADNIQYLTLMSAEKFEYGIEAYTYPDEFGPCDGSAEIAPGVYVSQQDRQMFGLSYRTLIGNDTEGTSHGYKIHLVYGGLASVSEKPRSTVNDSPEAGEFSWDVSTTPVEVPNKKPTAHLWFDSTKVDATKMAALEAILYGDDENEARLPLPSEIIAIFADNGVEEEEAEG